MVTAAGPPNRLPPKITRILTEVPARPRRPGPLPAVRLLPGPLALLPPPGLSPAGPLCPGPLSSTAALPVRLPAAPPTTIRTQSTPPPAVTGPLLQRLWQRVRQRSTPRVVMTGGPPTPRFWPPCRSSTPIPITLCPSPISPRSPAWPPGPLTAWPPIPGAGTTDGIIWPTRNSTPRAVSWMRLMTLFCGADSKCTIPAPLAAGPPRIRPMR